jgi:hypothetical protein
MGAAEALRGHVRPRHYRPQDREIGEPARHRRSRRLMRPGRVRTNRQPGRAQENLMPPGLATGNRCPCPQTALRPQNAAKGGLERNRFLPVDVTRNHGIGQAPPASHSPALVRVSRGRPRFGQSSDHSRFDSLLVGLPRDEILQVSSRVLLSVPAQTLPTSASPTAMSRPRNQLGIWGISVNTFIMYVPKSSRLFPRILMSR